MELVLSSLLRRNGVHRRPRSPHVNRLLAVLPMVLSVAASSGCRSVPERTTSPAVPSSAAPPTASTSPTRTVETGDERLRSFSGSCDENAFTPADLRELFEIATRYPQGDDPRRLDLSFRRRQDRANLSLVDAGHFDDSVEGSSRDYELEWRDGRWNVLTCDSRIRCYRGNPRDGRCP